MLKVGSARQCAHQSVSARWHRGPKKVGPTSPASQFLLHTHCCVLSVRVPSEWWSPQPGDGGRGTREQALGPGRLARPASCELGSACRPSSQRGGTCAIAAACRRPPAPPRPAPTLEHHRCRHRHDDSHLGASSPVVHHAPQPHHVPCAGSPDLLLGAPPASAEEPSGDFVYPPAPAPAPGPDAFANVSVAGGAALLDQPTIDQMVFACNADVDAAIKQCKYLFQPGAFPSAVSYQADLMCDMMGKAHRNYCNHLKLHLT